MFPHCYKKRFELSLVIDYYENKISGTEAIVGFNSAVKSAIRTGKIRNLEIPEKFEEGKKEARARTVRGRKLLPDSTEITRDASNITGAANGRPRLWDKTRDFRASVLVTIPQFIRIM